MEYDKDILERTGIFVFNNAISSELCKQTIDEFHKRKKEHKKGGVAGGYNPTMKNTTDWHINNSPVEKKLYSILNEATEEVTKYYWFLKKIPFTYTALQFQLNRKNVGFFRWHSDNDENNPNHFRILAPIFYLNDVEKDGFTEFPYQKINIKPEEGKLVIFPATWQYLHRGVKPTSNDKYIITCFALSPR